MEALLKQHRALLTTLVWWYVRRRLRGRAERAITGLVSGEALGIRSAPKKRSSWWKWLLAVTVIGGVAWLAWRLSRGGDDDEGAWGPIAPEPPFEASGPPSGGLVDTPDPAVPAGA